MVLRRAQLRPSLSEGQHPASRKPAFSGFTTASSFPFSLSSSSSSCSPCCSPPFHVLPFHTLGGRRSSLTPQKKAAAVALSLDLRKFAYTDLCFRLWLGNNQAGKGAQFVRGGGGRMGRGKLEKGIFLCCNWARICHNYGGKEGWVVGGWRSGNFGCFACSLSNGKMRWWN